MRQSKAFGVHFVITASRLNVLSGKLYSLFTERLTLRLAEADDYPGIVGGRVGEVEEIAGRGFTRVDRQPLAFQVALPLGVASVPAQPRAEADADPRHRRADAGVHGRLRRTNTRSRCGSMRCPSRHPTAR